MPFVLVIGKGHNIKKWSLSVSCKRALFLVNQSCSYPWLFKTVSWCIVFRWVFEALKSVCCSFLVHSFCIGSLTSFFVLQFIPCTALQTPEVEDVKKYNCLALRSWKSFQTHSIYAFAPLCPRILHFLTAWEFVSVPLPVITLNTRFLSHSLCFFFLYKYAYFDIVSVRGRLDNKGLLVNISL